MREIYAYRLQGRRLLIWATVSGVALGLSAGMAYPAPWYVWAVLAVIAAGVAFLLIRRPATGVRLLRDRLILSAWQKPRVVLLRDIEKVVFIGWSDQTDMEVQLKSGHVIRVFSGDIPPRDPFIDGLTRMRVPVEER